MASESGLTPEIKILFSGDGSSSRKSEIFPIFKDMKKY
jgi:hypothetical protein